MTLISLLVAVLFTYLSLSVGNILLSRITLLHGPVYVPSTQKMQQAFCTLAALKPNQKTIDLGSGDGSLVIAIAKAYPENTVVGVELNPLLVLQSRKNIRSAGLEQRVKIIAGSMWNIDLRKYDVVLLYGTQQIMPKLEQKVLTQMKPGSKILSSVFTFPTLSPTQSTNKVFQYILS